MKEIKFRIFIAVLLLFSILGQLLLPIKLRATDYADTPDLPQASEYDYETVEDYFKKHNECVVKNKDGKIIEISLYGQYGQIKDLTGLYEYNDLETLKFDTVDIQNIDLTKMSKLKYLEIKDGTIDNIYMIQDMTTLEKLTLDMEIVGEELKHLDLSKLEKLTQLKISLLRLYSSVDIVVSGIECLTNLEILTLDYIMFEKLDFSNFKELKILEISGNIHVECDDTPACCEITGIRDLEKLEEIRLECVMYKGDFSTIKNLKVLRLQTMIEKVLPYWSNTWEFIYKKDVNGFGIENILALKELDLSELSCAGLNLSQLQSLETIRLNLEKVENYSDLGFENLVNLKNIKLGRSWRFYKFNKLQKVNKYSNRQERRYND